MKDQTVVAAFEVWQNGDTIQTSSLYLASEIGQRKVNEFIGAHFMSNTFANLEEFTDEAEAIEAYDAINNPSDEELDHIPLS